MGYKSLKACLKDLERQGHLVRIKEEVDPYLEMAAIHLRVNENNGPAIWFENIKGCSFSAASNLFGSLERSKYIFRDTLEGVKRVVQLKKNPIQALKDPFGHILAINALPYRQRLIEPTFYETQLSSLPQIQSWPQDGGPFVLLPQVYTEDCALPGVMHSNLGCYRIQINGNDYLENREMGLHYQLHRGIGVHQKKCNDYGLPLKVSIFVGGAPAQTLAAVMPLPEGMSELTFAGLMNNRRFRYFKKDGFVMSSDADFVITGEVLADKVKPEGPFGDHLGYYSLQHNFPVLQVNKVYHKKDAIWPFTVVGRPPQEDTQFAELIQEITGPVLPAEIPGLKEVHAVDAAGVHPLLLAIGSERYTPYNETSIPQELLTIANHILGYGQLSLAKYLLIACDQDNPSLKAKSIKDFLIHILERIDFKRDLHFYTNTTIDTLDYSGTELNTGSKVVWAARGTKKRSLLTEIPGDVVLPPLYSNPKVVTPGVIAISGPSFTDYERVNIENEFKILNNQLCDSFPLLIICDDSEFLSKNLENFLWATFTRSNPSHDIYGVDSFVRNKHWGCNGSLIIDARIKPHHAPIMEKVPEIEKKVDGFGEKGRSLYGII